MANILRTLFGGKDDDERFDANKATHGKKEAGHTRGDDDDDDDEEDDDVFDPQEEARQQKQWLEQVAIPFLPNTSGKKGVGDLIPLNYRGTKGFSSGPFGIVLPREGTWAYVIFTASPYSREIGREKTREGVSMRTSTGVAKGGTALDFSPDSGGFAWRIK